MAAAVTDFTRRSFLYRKLQAAGARFERIGEAAVARACSEDDIAQSRILGVIDLSPLPRTGFKGRGAPGWLAAAGVAIPDAPNWATRQADGALVARLSAEEHLLLSDLATSSELPARLEAAWSMAGAPGIYHLPRADSHCWLLVTGAQAPTMLAKLCAVDLRADKFADLQIAQTSVARITAIIIRDGDSIVPSFHLLIDSASAEYFWDCLLDACQEFGGRPVGIDAVRTPSAGIAK